MGRAFEQRDELAVDATPERVWEAIATGPGINSWFMGRNEVEAGSTVRTAFGQYAPEHRVTAWEPGKRLAYGGERADDGRFIAYEFLIEGRDKGSATLRMVTSGFIPGDDWEDEFEAMAKGGALFFATLRTYLTHFAGRTATPITAFGPVVSGWDDAWAALRAELGLSGQPEPGTALRYHAPEVGSIDGVVYFANSQTLGVLTSEGIYRFVQGLPGCMVAMHCVMGPPPAPRKPDERAWQSWLERVFA